MTEREIDILQILYAEWEKAKQRVEQFAEQGDRQMQSYSQGVALGIATAIKAINGGK